MRILAGELKGRPIVQPKADSTRPMTEKVRAAIFDVIGSVNQFDVIDAYAGSGAAGFEALSRGARAVWSIERAKPAVTAIKQNLGQLGFAPEGTGTYIGPSGSHYYLSTSPIDEALAQRPRLAIADLVIADPPYGYMDVSVINRLGYCLADEGILVLSHSSKTRPPLLQSLELVKSRRYGDSTLSFYRKS